MAKRKITVTVDEELVSAAQELGDTSLSAVVNMALFHEMDRRARAHALRQLLDRWETELGPVPASDLEAARAAFDQLDGLPPAERVEGKATASRASRRKRGVA